MKHASDNFLIHFGRQFNSSTVDISGLCDITEGCFFTTHNFGTHFWKVVQANSTKDGLSFFKSSWRLNEGLDADDDVRNLHNENL